MNDKETTYKILKRYSTDEKVIEELATYTLNRFQKNYGGFDMGSFPLPDEAHIPSWENYVEQSKQVGVFEALKSNLVQLHFPIAKNISQSEDYRAATLKGASVDDMATATGLGLNDTGSLELYIHESYAGKIPVLIVPDDEDFSALIRALSHRNEPAPVPGSMGAAMINGINNWGRINALKDRWSKGHPFGNWKNEFVTNVLPNKALYQDRLIVLSKKPYSGVSNESMGLPSDQWMEYSMRIRLEHEYTHFFTLKTFGHMANNMHDELIADYMGVISVLGRFDSHWFLKFIGLEEFPAYRKGARFENYLGNPRLSERGFEILRTIIYNAVDNVATFDDSLDSIETPYDRICRLLSLASTGLLELSSDDGHELLRRTYDRLNQPVGIKFGEYEE